MSENDDEEEEEILASNPQYEAVKSPEGVDKSSQEDDGYVVTTLKGKLHVTLFRDFCDISLQESSASMKGVTAIDFVTFHKPFH